MVGQRVPEQRERFGEGAPADQQLGAARGNLVERGEVLVGQLGLPVTLAIIGGEPARFRPLVDLYHRSLREAGHDPEDFPMAVHGLGHIADDTEEAAEAIYPGFKDTMTRIGRERGWPLLHSGTGNLPQELILRSVELLGTEVSQLVRGR